MEDPIKKGATVQQVAPVIKGEVLDVKFNADTMSFVYLVGYTDKAGDSHQRWFPHAELAEVVAEG